MTELTGRFSEALILATQLHADQTRKGKAVPYIGHPLAVASLVLESGGNEDQAIAALRKAKETGVPWAPGWLGFCYAVSGDRQKGESVLQEIQELSTKRYVPPTSSATVYFGLGQLDKAFAWTERAFEEHDSQLIFFNVAPEFEELRSDQRFKTFLKKLKLGSS